MSTKPVNAASAGDRMTERPSAGAKRADGAPTEAEARRLHRALDKEAEISVAADGGDPSRLLNSLFRQALERLAGHPTPNPVLTPGETDAADAAAQCRELVDLMLASPPAADGSAEVRLRIDQPWLPDTEVRLAVSAGGDLDVEFLADSLEAQRFLLPNLDALRLRLGERCDGAVAVRLTERQPEGGGDTGDGRSRNRRTVVEEADGE